MRAFMLVTLMIGSALLGVIVYQTDLGEVWNRLLLLGWWGVALLFTVFLLGFLAESASWLLTLPSMPVNLKGLFRMARILMVGSALESVTPLAGFGGEPIKAVILKRHYGTRYREALTSLLLTRTTDVLALVPFIALGLALVIVHDLMPRSYQFAAGVSLAVFTLCVLLFFLVQRRRAFSRLRVWWEERWPSSRRWSEQAATRLEALDDIEQRLAEFYSVRRWRFFLSVTASFGEWSSGALAAYLALALLGHPITLAEGIVIEAFMLLVNSALFFVPGDIGTQESALVVTTAAITGSSPLGVALAAIRRARDLLWVLAGLAIGGLYSLRREDQAPLAP